MGETRGLADLNARVQEHFHDHPLSDGWIAWNLKDDTRYNALIEPLQVRREADTADGRPTARLRMVPGRQHSNLGNAVHGGITLGLVDIALFASCHQFGVLNVGPSVTLNLDTQFIGAGRIDEPLDAVTELVRETGRLVFLRGLVVQGHADQHIVASYTGTIRKAPPPKP
ncbi:MAG: PaaI family thioesterase [Sphingopyxis sp.]|nr:PaaI family thioesterase [Sphingopyxis sp.]